MKVNKSLVIAFNLLIIAGIIGLYILHYFDSNGEIAYVNSNKLILEYKGMKDAQALYDNKLKSWMSNLDTLQIELEALQQKLQEKEILSKNEIKLLEAKIQLKEIQKEKYKNSVHQLALREDEKLKNKILNDINAYIKKFGREKGYKIIMGATDMGNIVYAEEGLDITNEILLDLNNNPR